MRTRVLIIAAAIALVAGHPTPATAKSEKAEKSEKAAGQQAGGKPAGGKSRGSTSEGATAAAVTAAGAALAGILLSDRDRHAIAGYFQQNPLQSQPLPPGIARNLARGKPLPPGIAKRGLPNALTSQLSIPSGYELLSVGTDVLLVAIGSRIIADVLRDVAHN